MLNKMKENHVNLFGLINLNDLHQLFMQLGVDVSRITNTKRNFSSKTIFKNILNIVWLSGKHLIVPNLDFTPMERTEC